MRKIYCICLCLFCLFSSFAQEQKTLVKQDTVKHIEEIKIKNNIKDTKQTDLKNVASIDELLANSTKISFIKRGAYAWEPLLNNMTSERSSITIDGMHVFGACTDKMDPISSYMESNALSSIEIQSGQSGNMNGATVAGNLNFKLKNTPYGADQPWQGVYQTGFEFNNRQFFNLGNVSFSNDNFVVDAGASWRKAANYFDGNNQEIKHSQYQKFNSFLGLGYKTGKLSSLRVDALFDQANDVGYLALPMDLWLSRALITAVNYKQLFEKGWLRHWDTKVYYNALEHYMDDTKRPENLVHMDMPGWSTTYGFLSRVELSKGKWRSENQINGYENISIAEMTMYPQDRSNKTMFAYTWPWVTTRFVGLSSKHIWDFSDLSHIQLGASLGYHYNHSKYAEFNKIFYPESSATKSRLLPSLQAKYAFHNELWNFSLGAGYGQRAPSVSEGYGYYIYNSFDRYDYIGNPDLKNETSFELNANLGYKHEKMSIESDVNYFNINNYIVGRILTVGSPMNYQSVGVKGYTSLNYARLLNIAIHTRYDILQHLHWKGSITYAQAKDDKDINLPFIRPLSYRTSLQFMFKQMSVFASVNGDFAHQNYSPLYGEQFKPSYNIWNMSADYAFHVKKIKLVYQIGVENLFNQNYITYADWGNIPRMGRNVITSLKVVY